MVASWPLGALALSLRVGAPPAAAHREAGAHAHKEFVLMDRALLDVFVGAGFAHTNAIKRATGAAVWVLRESGAAGDLLSLWIVLASQVSPPLPSSPDACPKSCAQTVAVWAPSASPAVSTVAV